MYDRFRSPRSAAQLGLAEQAVGRWEDAEVHVSEALRSPSDSWVAKHRAPLDQALAAIRAHIARIEISGDPPGAEVRVNGRAIGRLPLARAVVVPIGQVDIECRAAGHKVAVRTLTLGAAEYQRVFVRLDKDSGEGLRREPAPKPAGAGLAASASDQEPPTDKDAAADGPAAAGSAAADTTRVNGSSTRAALKWTTLGLAVAGLGTGIAGTVVREQKVNEFRSTNNGTCRDDGGRAVDLSGTPVATCQGPLDAQKTATIFQIAGFAAAGAFAATWLILQLTEPDGEHAATAEASRSLAPRREIAEWTCAPGLSPGRSTLACTFAF